MKVIRPEVISNLDLGEAFIKEMSEIEPVVRKYTKSTTRLNRNWPMQEIFWKKAMRNERAGEDGNQPAGGEEH